jgi:hypothetical protein
MKNTIALTAVVSSQIHAIGYDPATGTLAVQFLRKGLPAGTYNYSGVPQDLYDQFAAAESKGKFFSEFIKGAKDDQSQPKYPHTKMDD